MSEKNLRSNIWKSTFQFQTYTYIGPVLANNSFTLPTTTPIPRKKETNAKNKNLNTYNITP